MDNTNQEEMLTPIPRKPGESITMDFPDAIKEISNGKRVRRLSWPGEDYGVLENGWLSVFTKGAIHTWTVSDGDMEGQDWIVIKEIIN
jgi:hypothetical protein